MDQYPNSKRYGLEERTFQFAKNVSRYVKLLPRTASNIEYGGQVIRSSGSVGANYYIEANEALGKKDFLMRARICRKESKESAYWLRLIGETNNSDSEDSAKLHREAIELTKIFSSIIEKSK